MDVDTEPPMDGPGEGPQLCEPIGVDADDASDGDGADASDAGDPRLILGSHRALDAIGGFVPPTDLQALRVVSSGAKLRRPHFFGGCGGSGAGGLAETHGLETARV